MDQAFLKEVAPPAAISQEPSLPQKTTPKAKKLAKRKIIRVKELDNYPFERDEQQDLRVNKGSINMRRNLRLQNVRHSFPSMRPKQKLHKALQRNDLRMSHVQSVVVNHTDSPNSTMSKNQIVRSFLMRNAVNPSTKSSTIEEYSQKEKDGAYEPFALKFKKFTVREF